MSKQIPTSKQSQKSKYQMRIGNAEIQDQETTSPLNQINIPPTQIVLQLLIWSTICATGLIAFFYQINSLTDNSTLINLFTGKNWNLAIILFISEAVIVLSATIASLITHKKNYALFFTILTTLFTLPAIYVINNNNYFYISLLIIITLLTAFTVEIKNSLHLYLKFNIYRIITPHLNILYLALAIATALPLFAYMQHTPNSTNQLVEQLIVHPTTEYILHTQGIDNTPSTEELPGLISELNLPNIQEYMEINFEQITSELDPVDLQALIEQQVQNTITPYLPFLPIIFSILIALTVFQLNKLLTFIFILTTWIAFRILLSSGIWEIRQVNRPVEELHLN